MVKLKRLKDQVLVITGATSAIGLATARRAVRRGARVVAASRNEEMLRRLVDEITAAGGEAVYVVADLGRAEEEAERIAEAAVARFGGFDTWFNNASVSTYGRLMEIPLEEQHRLFDTNYWGIVYGSRVAVEHLRERGGALINLASVLADRAVAKQGPYCAAKSAVKGFTEALRLELEEDRLPVSVSLIKPGATDAYYREHARNYLPRGPQNPQPYVPEAVAEAVLYCAEHPKASVVVGAGGKMGSMFGRLAPRLTDRVRERLVRNVQELSPPGEGAGGARLPYYGAGDDLYAKAARHPVGTAAVLMALAGAAAVWRRRNGG